MKSSKSRWEKWFKTKRKLIHFYNINLTRSRRSLINWWQKLRGKLVKRPRLWFKLRSLKRSPKSCRKRKLKLIWTFNLNIRHLNRTGMLRIIKIWLRDSLKWECLISLSPVLQLHRSHKKEVVPRPSLSQRKRNRP